MVLILKNSIRCKRCGYVIESTDEFDCVYCKCGGVFIDGGHLYQHAGGESLELIENVSVYVHRKSDVERRETVNKLIFIFEGKEYSFDKKTEERSCNILGNAYRNLED